MCYLMLSMQCIPVSIVLLFKTLLQQGKISEAEQATKTLFGKERVAEVMQDLRAASQGSAEPEAGWFDLFSSRYSKGKPEFFPLFSYMH